MAGQQQLSTSDDTTRSSNQKNVKVAESEDQWESRVIIISNRIRHVSFAASAYNQQQQHSFGRKAQQKTSQSLRPTGVIIQSHETSIGGDLDTDPALRFRIGGSYIIRESVKLNENCFARRRILQGNGSNNSPVPVERTRGAISGYRKAKKSRKSLLTSESHDRACLRAGDPPTLALALDDACGDPESSRSRSSHAYAGRIDGISPDDAVGRWAACGAYRIGSESYVDNLRGYAETPSGPPSVHTHPGKGQCALCGRWF